MIDLKETIAWTELEETKRYVPAEARRRIVELAGECEKLRQDHKAMLAVQNITARECAEIAEVCGCDRMYEDVNHPHNVAHKNVARAIRSTFNPEASCSTSG